MSELYGERPTGKKHFVHKLYTVATSPISNNIGDPGRKNADPKPYGYGIHDTSDPFQNSANPSYNEFLSHQYNPNKHQRMHIGLDVSDLPEAQPNGLKRNKGKRTRDFFPQDRDLNNYYNR
jgi:hypothetical protein